MAAGPREKLGETLEFVLRVARIPGAALAVVAGGDILFAAGYGYRDVAAGLPATAATVYPIASTTKAINATVLGMLVDAGALAWDAPVQHYLPRFRLWDPTLGTQVTIRDLLAMRTGLPRHDYVWIENPMSRAELVERLPYLELSAGFRERFQYNNITSTIAGHVAEVVTGQHWEDLVQQRIITPLVMKNTGFTLPTSGAVTVSYHENSQRELLPSRRLAGEVTAPSGGSLHSTVEDMARWMIFNLGGGKVAGCSLIQAQTLLEIQSPQVIARTDPSAPTANAAYALGWFVDTYNGCARLTHGGYIHDVNSEVTLFPEDDIGVVSFINFGFPALARLINQYAFDLIKGFTPVQTFEEKLAQYEEKVEETRRRNAAVRRVLNTAPSHALADYAGTYTHPGYGRVEILRRDRELLFRRNRLVLPLEHWHYDSWTAGDSGLFFIHAPHAFDPASRISFATDSDGRIAAVSIRLEPAVAPIRFEKVS
jgi:CubicO group peptidase (beta-lactamase class C family)